MTKSDDKRVPTLRFNGFTDEWEQRKLGDVLSKFDYGLNSASSDYDGKNKYLRITDIDEQTHRFNLDNLTSPKVDLKNKDNYILHPGDIVFARTGASVGKTYKYREDDGRVYFAGFLIRGRINKNFDTSFIFDTTLLPKYSNFVKITSIRSGQPGINSEEYKKYVINIPTINEQKYISKLITNLEELITLQQRKLKLLKLLKKAMLQTLFTNKSIPNLRFISFDKSWDIVKLKDVGKATGGTSIESEFTSIEGTHKVISIGSYKENHTYNDQGIRVNLNDKTKKRVLNKDDLTMILNDKTTSGRIIGSVLLIPVDNVFVYNQRTERIEPNHKKFSSKFLYQYLNSPNIRNKIVSNAQGNTQIYVNWSSISKIKYLMPQKKEQDKISKLLFTLDFIINNQQLRIKKYERFKQFLLQNMFI